MGRTYSKYDDPKWIGQKFNFMTIIGVEYTQRGWYWRCKCDCGEERLSSPYKIINGTTKSCGCKKVDRCHDMTSKYRIKHGGKKERLYGIWHGMKQRCYDSSCKDFDRYGKRGICVCENWRNDYNAFREWSINNGYDSKKTIDRIDVNGNYAPDNCRWITLEEQNRNKEETIYLEYNGERKSLADWCDDLGIKYQTVYARIYHNGWSVNRALSTPVQRHKI